MLIRQAIRVLDGLLHPIRCASRTANEPFEDCKDPERGQVRSSITLAQLVAGELADPAARQDQTTPRAMG